MRFLIEMQGVKAIGGKILHIESADPQANIDPELRDASLRDGADLAGDAPHARRLSVQRQDQQAQVPAPGPGDFTSMGLAMNEPPFERRLCLHVAGSSPSVTMASISVSTCWSGRTRAGRRRHLELWRADHPWQEDTSSMQFTPDAVDVFIAPALPGQIKCRICVGHVIGKNLYTMRKLGALFTHVAGEPIPTPQMIEASSAPTSSIPKTGTVTLPIFAHDLGVPCAGFLDDDEHDPECEQVGELVLNYHEIFLFVRGELPADYAHLKPVRLPLD